MSEPSLRYPTVDLFLYDLQDGLGQSAEEISQKRKHLWKGILNGQLDKATLNDIKIRESTLSNYIELLADRYRFFEAPYDGYYYPVKLGDTLGVQIDCAGKPDEADWAELSLEDQLQQMKACVLEHACKSPGNIEIPGDMGRSWFVWGQLAVNNLSPKGVAFDLLKILEMSPPAEWKSDSSNQGEFKGANFFELQKVDEIADGKNRHLYVLVCLFSAEQTEDHIKATLGQLYRHLMRLFYYRNKVLWAYEQGVALKNKLKNATNTIETLTQRLPSRLSRPTIALNALQQDLAEALETTYDCETNLSYLGEQAATIKVNLDNYRKRLNLMADVDAESKLDFLTDFADFAEDKYLKQLKTDEQTLAISLKPLETFVKTVEGIIEIEKAKNDRTLNQTIAIASVGISVASLTASTFNEQAKEIVGLQNPSSANQPSVIFNAWSTFGLAFGISLCFGLFGALITWLLLRLRNRR